jgi:hypothetical protein
MHQAARACAHAGIVLFFLLSQQCNAKAVKMEIALPPQSL